MSSHQVLPAPQSAFPRRSLGKPWTAQVLGKLEAEAPQAVYWQFIRRRGALMRLPDADRSDPEHLAKVRLLCLYRVTKVPA